MRIVKNPDGSLQKAAMTQAGLAKERAELRAAQREAEMETVPTDINRDWLDPQGTPHLAADLKGLGGGAPEIPEWKKAAMGGNKVSYGKKTSKSIIEQRESLPIFQHKDTLIQAITDDQVSNSVLPVSPRTIPV